ncbi:uncharacterized protein LOC141857591 [Brevipalpus obovatus]|uniref:uncharacterized protein LOC141857591 n=1 Tax=Brevipalpus obovatus TaxID=246614 RepID=UPI003D9EF505
MANKALINKDIKLKQQFQKIIQKNYSASIEQEDLTQDAMITKLNKWVSQETNNLIPQLFTQPFEEDTILILINVLYFKGLWMEVFEPCKKKQYFHNLDGTKSREYMQVGWRYELSPMRMPLLRLEDTHNLSEILPAMGLSLPFSHLADFTGITDNSLNVSSSVQKTVIIVDEKGTEAAAATYGEMVCLSRRLKCEFILDRPFIFFIRDEEILLNLFVGVVKNLPN